MRTCLALALLLATLARADDKKPNPKAADLEKKLLDVPADMKGDWLKAWRENLVLSYSEELKRNAASGFYSSGEVVRFNLENKTPMTLKVTGQPIAGLTPDGRPARKPAVKKKGARD